VISPFNFPAALTGGPAGAALVTGNTIVMKPATDTPWVVRLLAECFRDAGLPDGVFNFVTGPGRTLGQALIDSPEVDGVTFTGSYDVGMRIFRDFARGDYPRPPSWSWAARTRPSSHATPTWNGRHRHRALGLRPAGPEVLGLLAGLY
jgi:delta 1-pyrroline-5-carboxylate dehydrogenase